MNTRQKFGQIDSTLCYSDFMRIAMGLQASVSFPTVCNNGAAWLDSLDNERTKTYGRGIRNSEHTNSADGFLPSLFCSDDNQGLLKSLPTSNAFFQASQIGLIDLDSAEQSISARPNHGPSEFMKPRPCCLITTKTKNSLESKSTCTVFLGDNPPYSPEPNDQGFSCSLEDGSRCDRLLIPTGRALIKKPPNRPSCCPIATRTPKTVRPSQINQISTAFLFGGKTRFKFRQGTGIIFHALKYYMLGLPESIGYPQKKYFGQN
jgi:hypothetical protein